MSHTYLRKNKLLNDLHEYLKICNDNIEYLNYKDEPNKEIEIDIQEHKKIAIEKIIDVIESGSYDIEVNCIKLEDVINLIDSKLDEISDKLMNDEKISLNEFAKYLKAHSIIYELRQEIIEELRNGKKKTTISRYRC